MIEIKIEISDKENEKLEADLSWVGECYIGVTLYHGVMRGRRIAPFQVKSEALHDDDTLPIDAPGQK